MKQKFVYILLMVLTLMTTSCWKDDVQQEDTPQGEASFAVTQDGTIHCFDYTNYAPLAAKPVSVYYMCPTEGDKTTMPILFIFPGEDRSAKNHMNYFIDWAKKNKVMLFAFEFSTTYYPSTTEYILGSMNTKQSAAGLTTKENWNFNIIEQVFKEIRIATGSTQTKYDMWGHSAGAQYVHRFCTFMEDAHVNRAIAANSGWYTLADAETSFPYGYKEVTDVDWDAQLPKVFSRQFILQLGGDDTSTEGLNDNPGSVAQGATRLARGQYYYNTSKALAKKNDCGFAWQMEIVAGVGHDGKGMAEAAMNKLTY